MKETKKKGLVIGVAIFFFLMGASNFRDDPILSFAFLLVAGYLFLIST